MTSPFKAWNSSLVFRVTSTIVALSFIIIWLLGSALYNQISSGIFDEKLKLSILDAQSTARNTQLQLTFSQYQDKAALKLIFSEILAVPPKTFESAARELAIFTYKDTGSRYRFDGTSNLLEPKSVPESLREKTRAVSTTDSSTKWERTDLQYVDGKVEPAIAVGHILTIKGAGKYEFYVLFSLAQQSRTMSLILNYLWLTGIALTLLIGLITFFVLRRLISPIRDAARVAEELTAGNLE
nr:hypothetical protein [Actinomycetota bacterium]